MMVMKSCIQYYQTFKIIDTGIDKLNIRSKGFEITNFKFLKTFSTVWKVAIWQAYSVCDIDQLSIQLKMFKSVHSFDNLTRAVDIFKNLNNNVKLLFPEVQKVIQHFSL